MKLPGIGLIGLFYQLLLTYIVSCISTVSKHDLVSATTREGPAHLEFRCIHLEPLVASVRQATRNSQERTLSPIESVEGGGHDLSHHASPSNHIGLTLLTSTPFQIRNRLQQTVEMIIGCIIKLFK